MSRRTASVPYRHLTLYNPDSDPTPTPTPTPNPNPTPHPSPGTFPPWSRSRARRESVGRGSSSERLPPAHALDWDDGLRKLHELWLALVTCSRPGGA